MKYRQGRFDWTYLILAIPVLASSWPWIAYRVRPVLFFVLVAAWAIVTPKRKVVIERPVVFTKTFLCLACTLVGYACVQIVFAVFGYGDFPMRQVWTQALIQGSMLLVPYLSFKYGKMRELRFVTLVYLLGICLTAYSTYGASQTFDGAEFSRALTYANTASYDELERAYLGKVHGIGGYEYMYTMALLIPIVLLSFLPFKAKNLSFRGGLSFVLCLSAFVCLKNGGLGTPFLVLGVGMLMAFGEFFTVRRCGMSKIGACVLAGYVLFIVAPVVYSPLAPLMRAVGELAPEGKSIQIRCNSIADMISGDKESYANRRYDLQRLSWHGFLERPIFGGGAYNPGFTESTLKCGGHSMLLDLLAKEGLIGFVFYVLYFVLLYRFYRLLPKSILGRGWPNPGIVYIFSFIVASIANPFNTFLSLAYFLPGIVMVIRNPKLEIMESCG